MKPQTVLTLLFWTVGFVNACTAKDIYLGCFAGGGFIAAAISQALSHCRADRTEDA